MITLKEEVCFCCFPVCCFCFCFSLREDGGFCCFSALPFCRLLQANAAGGDENGGDAQPLSLKAPGGCPPSDVTSTCYKVGRIASRGAGS